MSDGLISLGIGTGGSIPQFILMGLGQSGGIIPGPTPSSGITFSTLRRRLAEMLRIYVRVSTSDAGEEDGSTFVSEELLDRLAANDLINGWYAYHLSFGTWRRISDFNAINGTVTLGRKFSSQIAAGAVMEVYRSFTPDQLDDAIRLAAIESYPYIAQQRVDTSLAVIAGQYEYTVPTAIRDLLPMLGGTVEVQYSTSRPTYPYTTVRSWGTRNSRTAGGNLTLVLPPPLPPAGRTLRLTGLGIYDLSSAVDSTSVSLEGDTIRLLLFKAAEILWRGGPTLGSRDVEFYVQQEQKYAEMFDRYRDQWGILLDPAPVPDMEARMPDLPFARNTPIG